MSERLEFREVNGDVVISLRGWGLPNKPFTIDGIHEIGESRAIGSPYTIHQPTGSKEEPTELTGWWSDYLLSSSGGEAEVEVTTSSEEKLDDGTSAIAVSSVAARTARDACAAIDDLRVRAALVRVSWAHIVRVGRIKRFAQKWETPEDVEWEMTLVWIGRDEDAEIAAPAATDPTADVRMLEAGSNEIFEATTFSIPNVEPTVLEIMDQRIAAIIAATSEMRDNVRSRVGGATNQVDVFRRGLGLFRFIADESELLALEIQNRVAATWIANADPEDLRDVDPAQVLAMLVQKRSAQAAARRLRHSSVRRRFDQLARVDEVVDIFILREGEDLQSLARHVYGSADAWTALRDFNRFNSGAVPAGTVVLVPRQRVAA